MIIYEETFGQLPEVDPSVKNFTFSMIVLIEMGRSLNIDVEQFVMYQLQNHGFPVIEREARLMFDTEVQGYMRLMKIESPAQLRYEWRPSQSDVRGKTMESMAELINRLAAIDPLHAQGHADDKSCFFCCADESMLTEANRKPVVMPDPECIWLQATKLIAAKKEGV